jgi:hypothetical protein
MSTARRISPKEAHRRVAWDEALLVCAYESEEQFHLAQLQGAISLGIFKSRLARLPKDQELIFYCG